MQLRNRTLPGYDNLVRRQQALSLSPPAEPAHPTINFIDPDFPVEVRLEIYAYVDNVSIPIPASGWHQLMTRCPLFPNAINLALSSRQIFEEMRLNKRSIFVKAKTLFFDTFGTSDGLTHFIELAESVQIHRLLRYLHMANLTSVSAFTDVLASFIRRPSYFIEHHEFTRIMEDQSQKSICHHSMPTQQDLTRVSRTWFPNLETLTIEVGRIDHLGSTSVDMHGFQMYGLQSHGIETYGTYKENDLNWPAWLNETDTTRNKRYRLLIQQIRSVLPLDLASGLKIIVKGRMQPPVPRRKAQRVPREEAVLHVTLTLDASLELSVHVRERWPAWSIPRLSLTKGNIQDFMYSIRIPLHREWASLHRIMTAFEKEYPTRSFSHQPRTAAETAKREAFCREWRLCWKGRTEIIDDSEKMSRVHVRIPEAVVDRFMGSQDTDQAPQHPTIPLLRNKALFEAIVEEFRLSPGRSGLWHTAGWYTQGADPIFDV